MRVLGEVSAYACMVNPSKTRKKRRIRNILLKISGLVGSCCFFDEDFFIPQIMNFIFYKPLQKKIGKTRVQTGKITVRIAVFPKERGLFRNISESTGRFPWQLRVQKNGE